MENKNTQASAVLISAMYRLGLLVVPMAVAVYFCSGNLLVCSILCGLILATWLCVDAGPFKATSSEVKSKPLFEKMQSAAKPQAVAGMAMKMVIFAALFHSRLMI